MFPALNAISHGGIPSGMTAIAAKDLPWFKVPAVVDVSGMEFTFALDSTEAAASASVHTVVAEDGGSTGTASSVLFTRLTNSPSSGTAWTAATVRNQTGSSATDLDADDVVALSVGTAGTASSGLTAAVAYIYGKPGSIA